MIIYHAIIDTKYRSVTYVGTVTLCGNVGNKCSTFVRSRKTEYALKMQDYRRGRKG